MFQPMVRLCTAAMAYWAALFRTPEFSKLSAHGNEHYTISASAFLPAE